MDSITVLDINNKVLLQWITIGNDGKDSVVLTFPKAFTTKCIGAVGCDVGSARYSYAFSNFTTTSVTWLKPTNNAGTRAWIFGF